MHNRIEYRCRSQSFLGPKLGKPKFNTKNLESAAFLTFFEFLKWIPVGAAAGLAALAEQADTEALCHYGARQLGLVW